jgi:starch-binding outer membrane protein, SusD/RagB family
MKSKMNWKPAAMLGLASLFGLSACIDLDEQIVSGVTASYYESAAGFEDAVRASYSALQDMYGQERNMTMLEMGTDTWIKGADGGHKHWNDYTSLLDPATSFTVQQWDLLYRAINTTNTAINRGSKLTSGMSESLKTQRQAELRFLRAFYYFYLVRHYGDVHLTLDETEGVVLEAKRTPQAEIYNQVIIPDLEFAVANLPTTQAQFGRVRRGAAQHLLALVYLTRNGPNNVAADLVKAEELGKAVIAQNTVYRLLPRYADLWPVANQRNQELIFTVSSTSDPLTYGQGNRWHLYWLMEYDVMPGMTRTIQYGRPFKRLRPTAYMLYIHDRENDTRYHDGFQHVWFANHPTSRPAGMAVGDTSIFIPGVKTADLDRATFCGKRYRVFTEPDNFAAPRAAPIPGCANVSNEYDYRVYPSLSKHQDPTRSSVNQEQGQRDLPVFRLADTYLMVAEALVRQGKAAEAVPFVNEVRRRAARPGRQAAMEVTAAQLNMDFILDERARELFGEGHRWFDLVRTGTLLQRVRTHNPDAAPTIQPHHQLRPIPQTQIDRTKNSDGTPFGQNPGY